MHSVIFEVQAHASETDAYFRLAGTLRPELERVDGFVDNVRYRSLSRPGWRLSLSSWRDERAVAAWRANEKHRNAQMKGRERYFGDYRLRVVVAQEEGEGEGKDGGSGSGVGKGTAVVTVVTDVLQDAHWIETSAVKDVAAAVVGVGRLDDAASCLSLAGWDLYQNVALPEEVLLLCYWKHDKDAAADAAAFHQRASIRPEAHVRQARVVRDYGMFDRHEAPQSYPDVKKGDVEES